jgi:hypothetical protein
VRGARIDFDFRGQVHLGERLLQNVLVIGRPLVVVLRDCDEELRLGFRSLKVRTVRHIRDESAAMERGDGADSIGHRSCSPKRNRSTHAVALRSHLPILGDGRLLVQPSDERLCVGHMRCLVQTLRERPDVVD